MFLCGAILSSALGCGGGGGVTSTVSKTTPPSIGAPSSISAVAGNGSVTLSWSGVTGATSYFVYSSLSTPVSRATATKHTVSGNTFVDTGLANGVRYYYVMTSVKSGIESSNSFGVSAVPGTTGMISGAITYEDKEIGIGATQNSGKFTGVTSMKAVRYAAVDVVNATTSSILYTTWTDSLGMYNIPTSTGSTSVYIRVNSEATPTGGTQSITVKNLLNSNAKYGVPSTNITLAGSANVNITIPTTNTAAGAFNILDVMTTGYDFIKYVSGSYPVVPLDVFWAPGNLNGTFFCGGGQCPSGDGIYVFSQTGGDTDEYDDDVLWHEFGHFVASTYSLDDSPGGSHSLGENDQDLRLAWSEGWGDFFPGAIKTWLSASGQGGLISSAPGVSLTTYVDTSGSGGFSFNFGNPPSIFSQFSSNEVAVAKLLTDLKDHYFIQSVWNVITNFSSNIPPITEPVNLELFWDRWLVVNNPSVTELGNLGIFYGDRSITYQNDVYESNPDNIYLTASTYTIGGSPQNHTLYSSTLVADVDYVVFSATTGVNYTITTSNLLNGADTYVTVYNSSGVALSNPSPNDNVTGITYISCTSNRNCDNGFPRNNTTNLSSKISFAAGYTGLHYVEIKSSPFRPNSAGRYGSYKLTITSP